MNASLWHDLEVESDLQPQGAEGKQLSRKVSEALQHWRDRAEVLIALTEPVDEFSYASVPPIRTVYVKTRYVFAGEGEPLPFDLEDD